MLSYALSATSAAANVESFLIGMQKEPLETNLVCLWEILIFPTNAKGEMLRGHSPTVVLAATFE